MMLEGCICQGVRDVAPVGPGWNRPRREPFDCIVGPEYTLAKVCGADVTDGPDNLAEGRRLVAITHVVTLDSGVENVQPGWQDWNKWEGWTRLRNRWRSHLKQEHRNADNHNKERAIQDKDFETCRRRLDWGGIFFGGSAFDHVVCVWVCVCVPEFCISLP